MAPAHRAHEADRLRDHIGQRQVLGTKSLVGRLSSGHRSLPYFRNEMQLAHQADRTNRIALPPKIAAVSESERWSDSMSAMVSATTVGPPSGMSVPNSTWSAPKKSTAHLTAWLAPNIAVSADNMRK